jgi:hypothetical protein
MRRAAERVFLAMMTDDDAGDFELSADAYRSLTKHITAAIETAIAEERARCASVARAYGEITLAEKIERGEEPDAG